LSAVFITEDWASPIWRLQNLYWIVDDHGNEVKFHLRDIQRELLNNLWTRNLILKSRQAGFSTLISILQLDQCLFVRNFAAATICDTKDNAKKMFRDKVAFPWKKLPKSLQDSIGGAEYTDEPGLISDTTEEFVWGNGSKFTVTSSARSGTLQSLHVSEYGKMCAKYPEKAKEVLSGSIPAVVQDGGQVYIESTAEGNDGDFHDKVMLAKQAEDLGQKLTVLDYRLHFFPWWRKPLNVLDPTNVIITKPLLDYFNELRLKHGIELSPKQMAWYAKTREQQKDLMYREHPSTVDEPFKVAVEGAIYSEEMAVIRKRGSIGRFPWDPRFPVNSFWDFGVSKSSGATSVWFHQRINEANRLIDFETGTDLGMGHWINMIRERPYVYGHHYVPHDARSRMQGIQVITREQMFHDKGIYNLKVVPQIGDKRQGMEMLRTFLLTCEFDDKGCAEGIKALDSYRREWDVKAGRWTDRPLHNWASDPVDALMQAAQGFEPMTEHYTSMAQMDYTPSSYDQVLEPETGY
jgi:hypothetical protein